jgi:hypothetical protein
VNVDQPLTFTATVTPVSPDSGLPPAGTVLFYDGATQIGTGTTLSTTSPYTSTFTTSALAVGPHSITAVFVDSDGQFVGSSSAILTETVNLIVPTIIWQPNPASLVYGTPLGSQQLNATAVDGDGNSVGGTFGYNFAAGAVLPVGAVNLIATFTPNDPTTYSGNSATVTISVTPAALTVTANSLSMIYGAAVPTFTYQIAGLVNNDPSSVVSGLASCSTSATSTSSVAGGPYAIHCTQGTLNATNYSFTFVPGALTVNQATASVTPNAATKVYGTTDPAFTGTLIGFVATDNVTASYSRTAGETVAGGPYTISATLSPTAALANYTITYNTANFNITLATASVTPNAATKVYGTADPSLTGTLSGFAASDNVTALYSRTAGQTVTGGPYPISATLSPAAALANYNITYNTDAFTISPAPLAAVANNASTLYGAAIPSLTGTLTGVVPGDGITASYTTVATSSSQAGSYAITPVLSDPNNKRSNYSAVLTNGTLIIAPDTTITSVQTSASPVMAQSSVTLTANVSSAAGAPSGSVTFVDGATVLATAALGNTGTATLSITTLAPGSHSITAVYAGNVNFTGSASSAITETVQDFHFSVNGATTTMLSATVNPGDTATYTLQIVPENGSTFPSAVVLTLTGLPAGATYTVTPSTIEAGSGTTTVTVKVNTATQQSTASSSAPKGGLGFPKPLMLAFFLPLFGTRKLRRFLRAQMKSPALMLVMLGVLMMAGMTACGSGSSSQPPQTSAMTLTGTSGALQHSVTLNLTVR